MKKESLKDYCDRRFKEEYKEEVKGTIIVSTVWIIALIIAIKVLS